MKKKNTKILASLKENFLIYIAKYERKKREMHEYFDSKGWNLYGTFVLDLIEKIDNNEEFDDLEKEYLHLLIALEAQKKLQEEVSEESYTEK